MRRPTEVSAPFLQARTSQDKKILGVAQQPPPNTQTKKMVGASTLTNQDQHPHHHKETVGSALLSHDLPAAVPSAQKGLTSRFGKDTGCNPLAKTTNTTKTSNTPKGNHSPVSETNIHLTTQPTNPLRIRDRVGREPHSGRKHHQTHQPKLVKQELLLVIGQLVLVSWSPYNVYTPSLSTR